MFGFRIIKTKELQRLRHIDETFVASIRSKDESIASLWHFVLQLKKKVERENIKGDQFTQV